MHTKAVRTRTLLHWLHGYFYIGGFKKVQQSLSVDSSLDVDAHMQTLLQAQQMYWFCIEHNPQHCCRSNAALVPRISTDVREY